MNFMDKIKGLAADARQDEPMSLHTSFKVGGTADFFVVPRDKNELRNVISLCVNEDVPFYVIGNGTNLIVGDKGYRGVVIQQLNKNGNIQVVDNTITAESGVLLSALCNAALDAELSGLEFATGIPGTVGGGVYMNAGAFDGELSGVVSRVWGIDSRGTEFCCDCTVSDFGYRHSRFQTERKIITSAMVTLHTGNRDEMTNRVKTINKKRAEKQPLKQPNAGSIFKRPEGNYAGKLVEDAGLKGFCIGDAAVSDKHCGFIINKGNACATDIIRLIEHCREQVEAQFGVRLETEVRIIGEV